MVQPIIRKNISILSDGSINLSSVYFSTPKQLIINEKDNKNFLANEKRNINNKIQREEFSSNYKKKYLF